MAAISGFPYFEVQFTKNGEVFAPDEVKQVVDFAGSGEVTDLFVISHGWNNDIDDARQLYRKLLARLRDRLDSGAVQGLAGRKFAVLAVLWPSKKFTEKELIPSGAASAGGLVSEEDVREEIDRVKDAFDSPTAEEDLERAKALVADLEDDPAARDEFARLLRSLLPPEAEADDEETPPAFFDLPGDDLLKELSVPVLAAPPVTGALDVGAAAAGIGEAGGDQPAGPQGGAVGFGLLSGIKGGAFKLLNLTTYYQMKERAGTVGRNGLNPVLRKLRERRPDLKLHLIGHSFGGRLVTAATLGPDGQAPVQPDTLTLLQAAFSHYGFSQDYEPGKNGFFRKIVTEGRVKGPVLITCTLNDEAVGKAYPIASQLAGQVAAGLGDKNSRYGGIGANGAQKTKEAIDGKLLPAGGAYQFAAGKLYNLNADAFIGNHSDISKNEVAHAVLTSVATT
ncbi:MAG TPA: hypothetical protein VGG03_19755 [Thermoanaerobaculia bacterium]|jgi:hypothetical protein